MKRLLFQSLGALVGLALVAFSALLVLSLPASAQRSFFDSIFGPYQPRTYEPRQPVDNSRAPAPHKPDTPPTSTVLVLGDSMADWLAYGLEEALADTPELGVVRKHRAFSGLVRYESKGDTPDWPQVAREIIAAEKPKFVVVMLGLHDRQAIRDVAPTQEQKPDKPEKERPAATTTQPARPRQAPLHEYGSEQWIELYTKKIDAMIVSAKSGGVPVLWIGLPAVRGAKSTGDMLFLNDLYRARAEKAGITYIDVWDGFVDEAGRFSVQGPDFEGQTRRLRTADGVHFTKAGARKLAHYVEREIRRTLQHGPIAVALPTSEPQPQLKLPAARPIGPAERPIAGPVLPLTSAVSAPGEELLGAPNTADKPGHVTATRVLIKGEAMAVPAGRSDDFAWPRRTVAPFNTDPAVATTTLPIPVMQPPPAKTVLAPDVDTPAVAPARHTAAVPRPPREPRRQSNPFFFLPFFR